MAVQLWYVKIEIKGIFTINTWCVFTINTWCVNFRSSSIFTLSIRDKGTFCSLQYPKLQEIYYIVRLVGSDKNWKEKREKKTLVHSLYTYKVTFKCLGLSGVGAFLAVTSHVWHVYSDQTNQDKLIPSQLEAFSIRSLGRTAKSVGGCRVLQSYLFPMGFCKVVSEFSFTETVWERLDWKRWEVAVNKKVE